MIIHIVLLWYTRFFFLFPFSTSRLKATSVNGTMYSWRNPDFLRWVIFLKSYSIWIKNILKKIMPTSNEFLFAWTCSKFSLCMNLWKCVALIFIVWPSIYPHGFSSVSHCMLLCIEVMWMLLLGFSFLPSPTEIIKWLNASSIPHSA